MANPRLEALVTVPTGGWAMSINDGGGPDTATITAGTYFVGGSSATSGSLLEEMKTRMDAATGKTFTLTVADDSSDTGFVTISVSSGTFTLTWTSTDLRDLLGFTGTLTPAAASFTGTIGCLSVFLPPCPLVGDGMYYTVSSGHLRTDTKYQIGPTGIVSTWTGNSYRSFKNVKLTMLDFNHAIDGASSTVTSWQKWIRETHLGGLSYFSVSAGGIAPTVRIYSDATANTLLGSGDGIYRLIYRDDLELPQVVEGWTGLWSVTIPEIIKT